MSVVIQRDVAWQMAFFIWITFPFKKLKMFKKREFPLNNKLDDEKKKDYKRGMGHFFMLCKACPLALPLWICFSFISNTVDITVSLPHS